MKKSLKRLVSLTLALVMVMSMFTVGMLPTAAVDTNGETVEIGSVADWNEVAAQSLDFSGKTVKLTADINKDGTAVDLATLSVNFAGTFDGQGFTIYNVGATTALIAATSVSGAVVKNVNVSTMVLTPTGDSAALIGNATDLTVENVSVSDLTLSAAAVNDNLGGIIGRLTVSNAASVRISNVKVTATLNYAGDGNNGAYGTFDGSKNGTGGVIGCASVGDGSALTIQSCLVEGSISSNESVGAILGYGEPGAFNNTTDILNCESKMTLSNGPAANNLVANRAGMGMIGLWHNGGSAGQLWKGTLNVTNCVNGGSMTSTIGTNANNKNFSTPGGMLGAVSPWRDNCGDGATINIKNCLLTGAVTTAGTTKGAMIGAARNFMNCAFNIENCATTQEDYNTAFGFSYVCTGTTLTVDGEDNTLANNAAPLLVLTADQAEGLITRNDDGYITAIGNVSQYKEADPDYIANYDTQTEWVITSLDEWKIIAESGKTFEGKTVRLGNDINAGGAELKTLFNQFKGVFDGANYTVSNANITKSLIANFTKGTAVVIKDLKVSNVTLTPAVDFDSILVGDVNTGKAVISNISVDSCTIKSTKKNYTTALVGLVRAPEAEIKDCTVTNVNLTCDDNGGLVLGCMNKDSIVTIDNVKVSGCTVTSGYGFGCVLGRMNSSTTATLTNCTVENTKITGTGTGLLVGTTAPAHNSLTVENCTAQGELIGNGDRIGGAVGYIETSGAGGVGDILKNVVTDVTISMPETEEDEPTSMGGLIGAISMTGMNGVTVINCKTTVTATTDSGTLGGIVGMYGGASGLGALTVSGCEAVMTLKSFDTVPTNGVGGVIGHCGALDASDLSMAKIYVNDCVLRGSLQHTTGESNDPNEIGSVGGIIGCCTLNGSFGVTVTDVLMDLDMNGGPVGIIVGESLKKGVTYTVSGCYSTKDYSLGGKIDGAKFNSTVAVSEEGAYTDDSVIIVSADEFASLIVSHDDGRLNEVIGHTALVKTQISAVENNKFNIRFISAFLPDRGMSAGYRITVKDANGTVLQTFSTDECDAYHKISAANGLEAYSADADDYFIAMTITDVPAGQALTFEVVSWYKTADGVICESLATTVEVNV